MHSFPYPFYALFKNTGEIITPTDATNGYDNCLIHLGHYSTREGQVSAMNVKIVRNGINKTLTNMINLIARQRQ